MSSVIASQLTDEELLIEIFMHTGQHVSVERVTQYLLTNNDDIITAIMSPRIQSNMHIDTQTEGELLKLIAEVHKRLKRKEQEQAGERPQHIRSTKDVVGHALPIIRRSPSQEHLIVFDLHSDLRIIEVREVNTGTEQSVQTSMGVVFRQSLLNAAAQVIIVHNHPSGSLTPSQADLETMQKMMNAAKMLDIILADMIIMVEDGRTRSIRKSIPG